jgi:cytochrome c peroxidase
MNINSNFFSKTKNIFFVLMAFFCYFGITSCLNNKKTIPSLSAKQQLGLMLFMDPRMSVDGTISCNSCHSIMSSGADHRSTSMGINGLRGGRNSPTVFNSKFLSVQFWDGRANTLADQAKGPLINPVEMGNADHSVAIERLKLIEGYKPYFKHAFGSEEINIDKVADAIADYEATLTTLNSPYDKYIAGDKSAMNEDQINGLNLFKSKGCVACHSGDHFSGSITEVGNGNYQKFPTFDNNSYVKQYNFKADFGRYDVTKNEADKHYFRIPTLRNIADTAPYFHNGSVQTLNEAIKVMGKTQLNQDITDIEALQIEVFLKALSGTIPPQTMPQLPQTPGITVVNPK